MLGSWIDETHLLFNKIVINKTPVILALDPDAKEKEQKIAQKLSEYCVDVKIASNKLKDFGDMTHEEAQSFINSAKHFDVTDRIRYLIGGIKSGSVY
jgi:orotidine-5'-phosphate decarboxylase